MGSDASMWAIVLGASPVVKIVLMLLLLASVLSWTIIFQRWFFLKEAHGAIRDFEERFWAGADLQKFYQELTATNTNLHGLAHIFCVGFSEFTKLSKQPTARTDAVLESTQRAMRVALSRETARLEQHLSFLATVGSTSPYVGLFGTVWGIMTSFRALGGVQQATIAMVAPGISEALIATAMGLFAAIPAVIFYNRYANDVERLANHYDTFKEEFFSILYRQVHSRVS
ncbi:MAG: protein TolQ [Gammaproteobacteria bacterium]|nr:protein TolQ [Gammaproteobacteria bacterium]